MIVKRLIRPERLRRVPQGFNWVDHRLVSQHYLERCEPGALALYLFLVTVSDVQGLSYYSDAAIGRRLKLGPLEVAAARRQLMEADLIAYQKPLYQVLSLESAPSPAPPVRVGQAQSVGQILRRLLPEGGEP
jgi:hypothetical protein